MVGSGWYVELITVKCPVACRMPHSSTPRLLQVWINDFIQCWSRFKRMTETLTHEVIHEDDDLIIYKFSYLNSTQCLGLGSQHWAHGLAWYFNTSYVMPYSFYIPFIFCNMVWEKTAYKIFMIWARFEVYFNFHWIWITSMVKIISLISPCLKCCNKFSPNI